MIRFRIENNVTFIDGFVEDQVKDLIRRTVGFTDEASQYRAAKYPGWDGVMTTLCYGYGKTPCKCFLKKSGMHFPSGLVGRVMRECDNNNIPYKYVDNRVKPPAKPELYSLSPELELRDYQIPPVELAAKRGRGIFKIATGGGKTSCAAQLAAKLGVDPMIFIVPSKDLLKQAKDEFERFIEYNGMGIKVGTIGNGQCDIKDLNVMTIQTAVRALEPERFEKAEKGRKKKGDKAIKIIVDEDEEYDQLEVEIPNEKREEIKYLVQHCAGYMADEIQHWSADTCQLIADHAKNAWYRYGFSATPWRDMGDDLLIDACFGKQVCDISASFLIDHPKKYLVQPTIYFVPIDNYTGVRFDSYQESYSAAIVENPLRNLRISNITNKLVDSGRMVLVLVKHLEHGRILQERIPGSVFLSGSDTGKVRQEHIDAMRKHKAPVTIASTIFDEGIDVRPLDAVILAGGGKSKTRALQRIGRAIRPYSCDGYEKKDAVIVDFMDETKWLAGHSHTRRYIYATEPRFVIKDLKVST